MGEPLLNVDALLEAENNEQQNLDNDSWGLISLGQVKHKGAQGILDIINAARLGDTVHFMSDGSFSQHELLLGALELTGPARMYVSTYAMSETSTRCIAGLLDNGLLLDVFAVVDNRIDTRSAGSLQLLKSIAKACVLVNCHSKVTVIASASASVVILGSANYTENKRIETGIITTSKEACNFHKGWILKTIADDGRNA